MNLNIVTTIVPLLLLSLTLLGVVDGNENCECDNKNFVDPLPRIDRVDPVTHQFLDTFGRTRWFHGTNVVTKEHPYHPDLGGPDVCNATMASPFCDADMNYIQELGVNVVRLGVMWAGAEPLRGEFNCTYFCTMHGVIQQLASRGIYTLVDVHQDVMARQLCGEGFPNWFMKKDWVVNEAYRFPFPNQLVPFTTDENGIPDPWSQCWTISDWFLSYLTLASGNAFGKFYTNYDGLLDSFADYWGKIAWEYRNYTSILGYDLLNEPWAGDIYRNPTLLIPGVAAHTHLDYLWQNCSAKIRSVDNDTLVFFESVTWDIQDGHRNVPGYDGTKAAMSYHYYAPPQYGLHAIFRNRLADQDRLQTGGILTEFRMWAGEEGEDIPEVMREIKDTVDIADVYLQSWMGWGYRSVLSRDTQVARHYARTYAPAVAGFVSEMKFVEDTSDYFIIWTINTSISAPTEIKINKRIYYPEGFRVDIFPQNALSWEAVDDQNLEFKYTNDAVNGTNVEVRISQGEMTQAGQSSGFSFNLMVNLGLICAILVQY